MFILEPKVKNIFLNLQFCQHVQKNQFYVNIFLAEFQTLIHNLVKVSELEATAFHF